MEKLKTIWKKLNEGWTGTLFYLFLGIFLAFSLNQILIYAITNTDLPIIAFYAVYSESMKHDNEEITFYQWLEKNFGYSKEYIQSWPFLKGLDVGDIAIIQKTKDYKVGDIIVFEVKGQFYPIIHRIVAKNEDGTFQTKGDNNLAQLPYEIKVRKEQIYGKVIFIIPKLGYLRVGLAKLVGV